MARHDGWRYGATKIRTPEETLFDSSDGAYICGRLLCRLVIALAANLGEHVNNFVGVFPLVTGVDLVGVGSPTSPIRLFQNNHGRLLADRPTLALSKLKLPGYHKKILDSASAYDGQFWIRRVPSDCPVAALR